MSEPAHDIQALLRALVEQQTALLCAHAESMRMQRVMVERLLTSGQALTITATVAQVTVAPSSSCQPSEGNDAPAPTVEVIVRDAPVTVIEAVAPMVADIDGPLAAPLQPTAPASAPPPDERPALREVGGTAIRSEHYYQAARPTPAQRNALPSMASRTSSSLTLKYAICTRDQPASVQSAGFWWFGQSAARGHGETGAGGPVRARRRYRTSMREAPGRARRFAPKPHARFPTPADG